MPVPPAILVTLLYSRWKQSTDCEPFLISIASQTILTAKASLRLYSSLANSSCIHPGTSGIITAITSLIPNRICWKMLLTQKLCSDFYKNLNKTSIFHDIWCISSGYMPTSTATKTNIVLSVEKSDGSHCWMAGDMANNAQFVITAKIPITSNAV